MQEKNLIIFLVLSFLIILVWMKLFGPKPVPLKEAEGPLAGETVAAAPVPQPGGAIAFPGGQEPVIPSTLPGATRGGPAGLKSAPRGETVVVLTDVYEVEFNSVGAAPSHWLLTEYPMEKCFKYRIDIAWPPLDTDPECDTAPVDLVGPLFDAPNHPTAAEVRVDGQAVKVGTDWKLETGDLDLRNGDSVGRVVFSAQLADGRKVKKIYRFKRSGYKVGLDFVVEGAPPQRGAVDVALFYKYKKYTAERVPRWNFNGAMTHDGKVLHKLDSDDVIKVGFMEAKGMRWAGFTSDYFLTAVLAEPDAPAFDFVAQFIGSERQKEDKKGAKDLAGWVRLVSRPEDLAEGLLARVDLFVGPKDKRILRSVQPSLQYAIDYGRLKILVLPLIEGLYWINRAVHNYGVSIIILTVILRMGMFPLTRTSQKSMKQMQKLQPEIQKIREKYPDDRAKQQEEMQGLWRKHKINPAMGCLPMLLQFPVFFAFYKALLISIELRQAPFFGWIIDLSSRDPLYLWPVAMGATQLVTQKMTPTQMEPTQQKMMMALPIVFMYILRDFPAGLLIYWTVQNLVGIGQQIYVNRQPD